MEARMQYKLICYAAIAEGENTNAVTFLKRAFNQNA